MLSERLRQSAALVEDLSLRNVIGRLSRLILAEAVGDTLLRPAWYTIHRVPVDELIETLNKAIRPQEQNQAAGGQTAD